MCLDFKHKVHPERIYTVEAAAAKVTLATIAAEKFAHIVDNCHQ